MQGLQGSAGVGKTSTLKTVREGAEQRGYAVEGFAQTARAARQLRDAGISAGSEPEELILSIRQMPQGAFLSRWWPLEHAPDEGLPGRLNGGVGDDSDVYENEYPLITAAHKKSSDEVACFSENAPLGPTLSDWDTRLRDHLTEAVRAEMRRGNTQDKSIQ